VAVSLVRQLHGTATGGVAFSFPSLRTRLEAHTVSIAGLLLLVSPRMPGKQIPYAMATFLIFGLCCYLAVFFELPPQAILEQQHRRGPRPSLACCIIAVSKSGLGIAVGGRFQWRSEKVAYSAASA